MSSSITLTKTILFSLLLFFINNIQAAKFSHEELIYMPASSQIDLFKQGKLSPVDVVKAQIKQYKENNKSINVSVNAYFDKALAEAKESEKRYKAGTNRPLEGITVGLRDGKNNIDPVVKKIKNSGAIILFQTTVPEYNVNMQVKNPRNNKYGCGGVSGGSGAALAAGYVTLATGSNLNESIIVPAALNGIYSYKPASIDKTFEYSDITGPMARDFKDIFLLGEHLENKNLSDLIKNNNSLKGLKIAYIGGMGIIEPSKEVKTAMEQAINALKKQGVIVDKVDINLGLSPQIIRDEYYDLNSKFKGKSKDIRKIYKILEKNVFDKGYDILMAPAVPTGHIPADFDFKTDTIVIDGIEYPDIVASLYTIPFNMTSSLPVLTVPVALSPKNIPIGFQLIGKPYDNKSIFTVTAKFNKEHRKKLFKDKLDHKN